MTIYFDVDGVLRNLTKEVLGREPKTWNDIENEEGENLFDLISEELWLLLKAPPTEYVEVVKELSSISILSSQPGFWRKWTDKWLDKHFPDTLVEVNYVAKPEKKLEFLKEEDILIDDYPLFEDNSQVVILDHVYNRDVKDCYARIKNVEDLKKLLEEKGELKKDVW